MMSFVVVLMGFGCSVSTQKRVKAEWKYEITGRVNGWQSSAQRNCRSHLRFNSTDCSHRRTPTHYTLECSILRNSPLDKAKNWVVSAHCVLVHRVLYGTDDIFPEPGAQTCTLVGSLFRGHQMQLNRTEWIHLMGNVLRKPNACYYCDLWPPSLSSALQIIHFVAHMVPILS